MTPSLYCQHSHLHLPCFCTTGIPGHGGSNCAQCEPGFFSLGGREDEPRPICKPCGVHFTSPAGSVSAAYCECQAGFGADDSEGDNHTHDRDRDHKDDHASHTCGQCPIGTFNPGPNPQVVVAKASTFGKSKVMPKALPCLRCDAAYPGGNFTTFSVGSKSEAACKCQPGKGGIGCSLCPKVSVPLLLAQHCKTLPS